MPKNNKELIVNCNFKMDGIFTDAICELKIYSDRKNYEVYMASPRGREFKGRSTTNGFERFATNIKHQYLKHVNPKRIRWVDDIGGPYNDDERLHIRVDLDWNGKSFENPRWLGLVA